MRSRSSTTLPREVAVARRRIDKWRAGNGRRRRIPEGIWTEAAELARVHGIHRVSAAMRLSHEKVKQRLEGIDAVASKMTSSVAVDPVPGFVEIAATIPPSSGLSVELADNRGRRMTIRGAGHSEVRSMVAAFWTGGH